MDNLQSLLDQYTADAIAQIEAIDSSFAAVRSNHDQAIARHSDNARKYAAPKRIAPVIAGATVTHRNRTYFCDRSDVIAALGQRQSPNELLHQWLKSEFGVYVLPNEIQYEVNRE